MWFFGAHPICLDELFDEVRRATHSGIEERGEAILATPKFLALYLCKKNWKFTNWKVPKKLEILFLAKCLFTSWEIGKFGNDGKEWKKMKSDLRTKKPTQTEKRPAHEFNALIGKMKEKRCSRNNRSPFHFKLARAYGWSWNCEKLSSSSSSSWEAVFTVLVFPVHVGLLLHCTFQPSLQSACWVLLALKICIADVGPFPLQQGKNSTSGLWKRLGSNQQETSWDSTSNHGWGLLKILSNHVKSYGYLTAWTISACVRIAHCEGLSNLALCVDFIYSNSVCQVGKTAPQVATALGIYLGHSESPYKIRFSTKWARTIKNRKH